MKLEEVVPAARALLPAISERAEKTEAARQALLAALQTTLDRIKSMQVEQRKSLYQYAHLLY